MPSQGRLAGIRRLGREFRRRVAIYRAVLKHPRTPRTARWLLGLALGYALLPFDLIPDWIPVLGLLDDLVILPLLVWLAIRAVPRDVYEECEREVTAMAEHTVVLRVEGMTCEHCVATVKSALEAVPGVTRVDVALRGARATVAMAEGTEVADLVAAVAEEGYEARTT